ncbi:MAG: glycosyltransferase family 4 protein [Balneolaceae bacterium]|nr:glycosyltransferase family 4 protein [Balneolaceae bacterium]
MSKKVLLLCQHFYPEMVSTGMHMTELSEALTEKGVDITVFCAPPVHDIENWNQEVPRSTKYNGIHIRRAKTLGKHKSGLLYRLLFAFTYMIQTFFYTWRGRKKFDGILVGTNPPFLGIVTLIMKKVFGVKYSVIVYDVYPEYANNLGVIKHNSLISRIWFWITKSILSNSIANITIGRDMQKLIDKKTINSDVTNVIIPNWSDESVIKPQKNKINSFRKELGLKNELIVLYSGTMNKSHNLEPLLDAAELLKDESIIFVFVGEGSNKENLIKLSKDKSLNKVRFLPFQPKSKLPDVLGSCDISVVCLNKKWTGISVPSKTYGIMAAGRPVMAFLEENSEIGLTINENNCGLVFENPTPKEIAEYLLKYEKNRDLLNEMGENSYEAFINNYTLDKSSEKYLNLIKEIF